MSHANCNHAETSAARRQCRGEAALRAVPRASDRYEEPTPPARRVITAKKLKGTENRFQLIENGQVIGHIEKHQNMTPTKTQGNVALAWRKQTFFIVIEGSVKKNFNLSSSIIYRNSAKAVAEWLTLCAN